MISPKELSLSLDTSQLQVLTPTIPSSPEEVSQISKQYFNNCLTNKKHPTFSGLARHLGLTREELINFVHENPQIHKVIQNAKQIIVDNVEQMIFAGQPPGGLTFWLKNNDNWVEKFEYQHSEKKISDLMDELEQEGKLIKGEVVE
ncbi:MAG: terminase small subunit [Candidatus Gracilibacteria bacterium]|jgi:hypothetical protein